MTAAGAEAASFAASARGFAAEYQDGLARVGSVTTSSPGEAVTVTLSEQGTVQHVAVGEMWEQECDYVEDLPGLILRTIGDSESARMALGMQQMAEHGRGEQRDPPGHVEPRRRRPLPDATVLGEAEDAMRAAGGLRGMFDQLTATMVNAASATSTGQSANGRVQAAANYLEEITALEIDPAWSVEASGADIGRAVTEATLTALDRAPRVEVADLVADSALGRVRQLLNSHENGSTP